MREHRLENNGIESDDDFKREDAESEVADSDDADEEETFEEKVKNGQFGRALQITFKINKQLKK